MTGTLPTKRWTRLEYDRLIEEGAFGPEDRIELLGGALVVREPQGSPPRHGHSHGGRSAASGRSRQGGTCASSFPWRSTRNRNPSPTSASSRAASVTTRAIIPAASSPDRGDRRLEPRARSRPEGQSLRAGSRVADSGSSISLDRGLEVYRDPVPDASAPVPNTDGATPRSRRSPPAVSSCLSPRPTPPDPRRRPDSRSQAAPLGNPVSSPPGTPQPRRNA